MVQRGDEVADAAPEGTRAARTGSSRHVKVDARVAEILVEDFPAFSVVGVREALEFEPVRMAIGILRWASEKPRPESALLNWARKRGRGYHRPISWRPDGKAEYRRYLEHLERKEAEALKRRGRGLSPAEVEDVARLWYAPAHRAAMGRIPKEAWREIHRELEEEEVA